MTKSLPKLLLLGVFISSCFISACGKTGPLYLPDTEVQEETSPAKQDK